MASKLNLSDVPLKGRLPHLLRNNRLGWKGLPEENTPAYYKNDRKKFYNIGPRSILKPSTTPRRPPRVRASWSASSIRDRSYKLFTAVVYEL
jgi:hypothetical protein